MLNSQPVGWSPHRSMDSTFPTLQGPDMTLTAPEIARSRVTVDDIAHLATVKVKVAAAFIGVSRNHYYEGVKAGTLPGLTLGRCVVVPVRPLLRLVDADPGSPTEAHSTAA